MQYEMIVFLQGDEAQEALGLLKEDTRKALDYLTQWDSGDSGDWEQSQPWGASDDLVLLHPYVINYNRRLDYVGLTKLYPKEE